MLLSLVQHLCPPVLHSLKVCSLSVVIYREWFGGGFLLCTLRTRGKIAPGEEVVVLLSNSRSFVINYPLMKKGQHTELCILVSPSCRGTFGTQHSEHIPHVL